MKQKLIELAVRWLLGGVMRDVAEGKKGPKLKAAYWWLAGRKRQVGWILGTVMAGIAFFDPTAAQSIAKPAAVVIGALLAVGFIDAQWRTDTAPSEWQQAFGAVVSAGPLLSAIAAALAEFLPKLPHCDWCNPLALKIQLVSAGVATATGFLAARFSSPPLR